MSRIAFGLLGLCLWILVLPACSSLRKGKEPSVINSSYVLSLEAFSCRGTCPVFHFTIDKKGVAHYTGSRYTERVGDFSYRLKQVELDAFWAVFEANSWDEIAGNALGGYQDIQRFELQFEGKVIAFNRRAASKDLLLILEVLEKKMTELPWTPD